MSSFEYLRSIGIGYYYPGRSFLHARDARVKIVFFALLVLALTFTRSWVGLVFGIALGMLGFILSDITLKPSLKTIVGFAPFILLLFILQVLIHRPIENSTLLLSWRFLRVYDSGLMDGALMLLRFLALLLTLGLLTSVVSTLEMTHGLAMLLRPLEKIGVKTEGFVMVVQIMLRFLPLLAIRMEEIAKSQASRGAAWDSAKGGVWKRVRLVVPLIVPLFMSTLHQAERTADAMLCRGYGSFPTRSHYYEYHIHRADVIFLLIGIGLALAIVLFPL